MVQKARAPLTAVLALALTGAGSPLAAAPQDVPAPKFPAGVEMVSVDVIVLDEGGGPVEGLSAADFTVEEDGILQQVASFEAIRFEESPAVASAEATVSSNVVERARPGGSFAVVFDDVHLTAPGAERARNELVRLVSRLRPGDLVTVVPTSGAPWWTARLPEGREDLVAYLGALRGLKFRDLSAGRVSDWEAMQIHSGRNPQVLGVVARRWYENGLLAEITPKDRSVRRDLTDLNPGLPMVRAKAMEIYQRAARSATAALSVIERVAESLRGERGRKAVLILSEGFFHDPTRSEFREVIRAAREANAVLYFFDAKGQRGVEAPGNEAEFGRPIEERDRVTTVAHFSRDAEGSESIALDTGGRAVKGTDDLAGAMGEVVRESRSYYLLGYVSSNRKRDGRYRRLHVSVTRPGVAVRTRKGYYAPNEKDERKRPESEALDPHVRASLDSPFLADSIPLRLTSYVFETGEARAATAVLAAEVDLRPVSFEPEADRMVGTLDTYVVVSPRDGGENRRVEKRLDLSLPPEVLERMRREGLPLLRDFALPPGTYQARLLVRDGKGRSVGAVRHTFAVPAAAGLRTSTPILTDVVRTEAGAEIPVPIARRRFPGGGRLVYAFDVYGAARNPAGRSDVAVGYVVRQGDRVFAESPLRPVGASPDGALSQRLVLSLAGADPGAYEILLTVTDQVSGGTLERRDAFVVTPP